MVCGYPVTDGWAFYKSVSQELVNGEGRKVFARWRCKSGIMFFLIQFRRRKGEEILVPSLPGKVPEKQTKGLYSLDIQFSHLVLGFPISLYVSKSSS